MSTLSRLYNADTHIDFVGHRKRWFTFSAVILVISVISLLTRGLDLSLDFEGGTVVEVPNAVDVSTSDVRDALSDIGLAGAKVQLTEGTDGARIRVQTEVLEPACLDVVAEYADILQVGSRNMHNTHLLAAVGKQSKPVLLKRGWSATFEEFLLAAEYIMLQGNPNVILCERGIRTHETYVRNTLALSIVPEIKRRYGDFVDRTSGGFGFVDTETRRRMIGELRAG